MKKSYSFLHKKLQEIEQARAQHEDVKQRIEFLKNFVSAEVSSHPSDSIPPPLHSISKQLTRLESGYAKGKDYRTTTSINDADKIGPDSCFSDKEEFDHQEDNNDPMPGLENVESSPVIAERIISTYEANEKINGRLKRWWWWCLVMMMSSALFFVIGATLMLSLCGCSGYYYHNNNVRLQYATGFSTPT